jgi:flagellar basal body-associated protein FliL
MKFTTWIVIAIVLVIGLGAVFLLLHKNILPTQNSSTKPSAIVEPKPVYAAQGKLTENFPTSLIIGAKPSTQSSFSVNYSNSNQYTAVFNTTDSISAEYNSYMSYFQNNKYEIISHQDTSNLAELYAINKDGDVSAQIVPSGKLSMVTVSYLKK